MAQIREATFCLTNICGEISGHNLGCKYCAEAKTGVNLTKLCFSSFSDSCCKAWMLVVYKNKAILFVAYENICVFYVMAKLNSEKWKNDVFARKKVRSRCQFH